MDDLAHVVLAATPRELATIIADLNRLAAIIAETKPYGIPEIDLDKAILEEVNRLVRHKLQLVRAYVRVTEGRRYIKKLEHRLTTDPNNPFRFNALTAPALNGCPRFVQFLDRRVAAELNRIGGPISMIDLRQRYPQRTIL